jgi:hypothetical protein
MLVFLMWLIGMVTVAATASGVAGALGFLEVITLPVILLVFHRAEFRRRIALANEPYIGDRGNHLRAITEEVFRTGGLLRVAAGLVLLAAAGSAVFGATGAAQLFVVPISVATVAFVLASIAARRRAGRYIDWCQSEYRADAYWFDANNRAAMVFGVKRGDILATRSFRRDGDDVYLDPAPPLAQAAHPELRTRLVSHWIDEYMEAPDSTASRIHLMPVTEEEEQIRQNLRQSRGMVMAESPS